MRYNLITNYYNDKVQERTEELNFCILENLRNQFINNIVIMSTQAHYDVLMSICDESLKSKIIPIITDIRPSYNDYFRIITKLFGDNDNVNIISNLDIIIPPEISLYMKYYIPNKQTCLALSRWDVNNRFDYKNNSTFFDRADSQDTWVFMGGVNQIAGADYGLGVAGCLSGETLVNYKRGKRDSGRTISLKKLYENFNKKNKNWTLDVDTYLQSFNSEKDSIIHNKIISVMQSGIKKTIKITFDNGENIVLTKDHKICSVDKIYKRADSFKIGDLVLSKGDMKTISSGKKRVYRKRKVVYVKYHPFTEIKYINGHKYKRVKRYRLVYEAHLNNMSYEDYLYCINNDSEKSKKLKFLPIEMEVHHKDDDTTNDIIENLEVFSKKEHAKLHYHNDNILDRKNYLNTKRIINIEDFGEIMTYDIKMDNPYNNFSANDVIVHNCDNNIAYLLEQNGYNVINPSRTIKTFHLHLTNIRNYTDAEGHAIYRVPSPYKIIEPSF